MQNRKDRSFVLKEIKIGNRPRWLTKFYINGMWVDTVSSKRKALAIQKGVDFEMGKR